ncbi:hypothetical protein BH11BAC1_BH11BAC1_11680 [soil metagenome]
MQKIFLAVVLAITISFSADAQKKKETPLPPPELPRDQVTNKITYEEVVDVPGKSADEIYRKILGWFHAYYKNPGEVIRENDSLKFSVMGKPRFKISNLADKEGTKSDAGLVQYTITVAAKDGRFKYTLTEFNWKGNSYYACEKWYDTALPSHTSAMDEYLRQTDNYAHTTVADLKNSVTNEKLEKNKNDW